MEKCEFFKPEVRYLGHIISAKKLQKDLSKVRTIQAVKVPTSKTEVRALVG